MDIIRSEERLLDRAVRIEKVLCEVEYLDLRVDVELQLIDLGVGQEIDLKRKLRVQRNRNIFRSSVLLGASSSKTSERLLYSIKVGLHESVQAQA